MSYIKLDNIFVSGIDNISRAQSLRELFVKKKGTLIPNNITILDDLSFHANLGDRIGILGLNGSGKTSLLKVIVGTYPPQKGEVNISGSICSSLGMGTLITELSGRDNIKLAFAYRNNLSQYSKEIENKIIEFSELGEFIDKPMMNYSSGMMARFAFSSVIFQKADILLLDEVFATGDASFIDKAKKHMTHHWENTDIGIFVSHDLSQISELCKTCYIFSNGKNYAYGETKEMISLYEKEILNR